MKNELFDLEQFNILQDSENYYFFRALNMADNSEIERGLIVDENGNFIRIRTDRQRWEENPNNVAPRYKSDSKISLEEVYDHIKMRHRIDTNGISLTSNSNVAVTYGRGYYKDRYVLVKIPKKELGDTVVNSGQYMLQEIEKRINATIENLTNQEIIDRLNQIDVAESSKEIEELMTVRYSSKEPINVSRARMRPEISYTEPKARLGNYQILSDTQGLEKDRIIGKLTLLERSGLMRPLIPYTADNRLLIQTVGNAFSSSEQTHYGEINGERVIEISKELADIFALLQQLPEDEIVNDLKAELLEKINLGYRVETRDDDLVFTNGIETSVIGQAISDEYHTPNNLTIDEIYNLTDGNVRYGKASSVIDKLYYLSKSKLDAKKTADILNQIIGNNPKYQDVIEFIKKSGFRIEPQIITRQSNQGYPISESVNIDLASDEIQLVDEIKSLTDDELLDIIRNDGLSNPQNIMQKTFQLIEQEHAISKERYYASSIIDLYDWEKIGIKSFLPEQREELIKKLEEKNCIGIYEKLKTQNYSQNEIAKIILNLVVKNKFESMLESENLQEIVSENIEELSQELSIEKVESFLGYYDVEGTQIRLKDYQQTAVNKTNTIFESKRFASVILPTGAGKSFVALTEMLQNKEKEILYLAPSIEILEQMQDYIIKYVHGTKGTLGKTKKQIVEEIFPNLTLTTYQSLLYKNGRNIINEKFDFIVLDELHRTGGVEWENRLNQLLENQNESVRVLGITATPERDSDGKNMAIETAKKLGYSQEEIASQEYIAMNMNLVDAIRLGLVVSPKIISCEYNLANNYDFEKILEKINLIEDENERNAKLEKYNELRRKIDKAEGISEILKSSLKIGGKYIVFIPVIDYGSSKEEIDDGDLSAGELKIKDAEEKLKQWLENSGLPIEMYSMLGSYTDKKNLEELHNFKADNGNTKFMIVMNKLNEGVHIDGIDGMIWMRPLDENSRILCLQQLGRVIYSIDDETNISDEDRPIVIDLPNNLLTVNLNKSINHYTKRDDLQLLKDIVEWIDTHDGYIPNINSSSKTETRYAATLRRIQAKYQIYLDDEILDDELEILESEEQDQILQILELGRNIDLWNTEFPNKENGGNYEDDIIIDSFDVKGILKDFEELIESVSQKETVVAKTLRIVRILKEYGVNFKNIQLQKNGKYIKTKNISQEGVDIDKIIADNSLDGEFELGKAIFAVRTAYRGMSTYAITNEEKKIAEELGLINLSERETSIAEMLRIVKILQENGVDLKQIPKMKKGRYLTLADIEQDGIDIKKIAMENDLDLNFPYAKKITAAIGAYNGTNTYAITEEEREEIERLGLISLEEKESAIEEGLRVAQILKNNGVNLKKVQKAHKGKYIKLSQINQPGIDIEKIARENNIDLNFKFGQRAISIRNACAGRGGYLITDEQKKLAEELGLIDLNPEKETAIAEFLRIARILKDNNVDVKKLPITINRQYARLRDLQQPGIDIEKICEENDLDLDIPIGTRISAIRDSYNRKSTYLMTEEEVEEAKSLGIIEDDKISLASEFIRVAQILKNNGVNLNKIQLNIKENGKYRGVRLGEIQQEGIDIEKIVSENGLDLEYDYGQRFKGVKNGYLNKKGYQLTEEERKEIERLDIIIARKKSAKSIGVAVFSDASVEKCDEADMVLNRLVENLREGEKDQNE